MVELNLEQVEARIDPVQIAQFQGAFSDQLNALSQSPNHEWNRELQRINKDIDASGLLQNFDIVFDQEHNKLTAVAEDPTRTDYIQEDSDPANTGNGPSDGGNPGSGNNSGPANYAPSHGGDSRPASYAPSNMGDGGGNSPGADSNVRQVAAMRDLTGIGNRDITTAAEGLVGEELWHGYAGVEGGNLGCAASVSRVLQRAGMPYADSALVDGLVGQLEQNGWTPTNSPQPGDVVYTAGTHVGIVVRGPNGELYVCHNDSSTGQWTGPIPIAEAGLENGQFLRPPGGSRQNPAINL